MKKVGKAAGVIFGEFFEHCVMRSVVTCSYSESSSV